MIRWSSQYRVGACHENLEVDLPVHKDALNHLGRALVDGRLALSEEIQENDEIHNTMLSSALLASSLLRSTLLASSPSRHTAPKLFGPYQEPQLAEEEYRALAGIWRLYLDLGDRGLAMTLHLATPEDEELEKRDTKPRGRVNPMENILCCGRFNIYQGDPAGWSAAWWSAGRLVHPGEAGDDILDVSLQMGNLQLEGKGKRFGLRCKAFVGKVVEIGDESRVVGRFAMGLGLPFNTNPTALEERYQERIAEDSSFAGDMTTLLEYVDDEELMEELDEACDAGIEDACDMVSQEEEAKKAWLASLDKPDWGATRDPEPSSRDPDEPPA